MASYSCNFCEFSSASCAEFKQHLESVHYSGKTKMAMNITKKSGKAVMNSEVTNDFNKAAFDEAAQLPFLEDGPAGGSASPAPLER